MSVFKDFALPPPPHTPTKNVYKALCVWLYSLGGKWRLKYSLNLLARPCSSAFFFAQGYHLETCPLCFFPEGQPFLFCTKARERLARRLESRHAIDHDESLEAISTSKEFILDVNLKMCERGLHSFKNYFVSKQVKKKIASVFCQYCSGVHTPPHTASLQSLPFSAVPFFCLYISDLITLLP